MVSFVGIFYSVFGNAMIGVFVTLFGANGKASQAFIGPIQRLMNFMVLIVFVPSLTLVLVLMCHDILENGHPGLAVGVLVVFLLVIFGGMLVFDMVFAVLSLEMFHLPKWLLWVPPFVLYPSCRRVIQGGDDFMRDVKARAELLRIAEVEGLDFALEKRGILHVYRKRQNYQHALRVNDLLAEGGLDRISKSE